MNGYDIFHKAMTLLGYADLKSDDDTFIRLMKSAVNVINQISCDLKCLPVSALSDKVEMNSFKQDAMCYGVAMMLSMLDGDADLNRIFTNIYNSKRSSALSEIVCMNDNLPKVAMG